MTILREEPEGCTLVSQSPYFEAFEIELRNRRVLTNTIDDVLKEMKGDHLNINSLKSLY